VNKRILLIRHGEVSPGYEERFIGKTDPPLSRGGVAAARQLRERIASMHPDRFYCSPLRRAVETLEAVGGKECGAVFDPRLAEIDFGRWENLLFNDILADSTTDLIRTWADDTAHFQFPGGESYQEFAQRVDEFMEELYEDASKVVAVVTHGGVLMRILSVWKGIPPNRQCEVLPPRGSLSIYEYQDGVASHVE